MLEWASLRNRPDVQEANGLSSAAGVPEAKAAKKTSIALALGGGCARGWAHIGVLRALDEAGIEISMIAGTSIGALVGGCYLAGKLDELEEFARSLTRRRMFGLLDFRLGGNGLLGGMRLDARLRQHLEGVRIEDLPKPFVCVASEIRSGHEIWLTQGSLSHGGGVVETFTVGTRLTHVTRALRGKDAERALVAAGETVPDWSGGTRLGETLKMFLDRWGQRGLARGAVVVVFSDGWERGDPTQLAEQVARLQRVAHRVVWVNPHRGKAGYEPLQQGVVAVLPYVDDFLAGHSLHTYAELVEVVARA